MDRSHPLRPLRNAPGPDPQAAAILSTSTTAAMAPSNPLTLAPSHPANPFPSGTAMHAPPTAFSQIQTQPHEDPQRGSGSVAHQPSQNPSTSAARTENAQATDQPLVFENYPHAIAGGGGGGPTATAPFLRDFSLVAEAAKRAQMSIVMRDLESVTL